jgi:hypothetical protein
MNEIVRSHLNEIEARLIECPVHIGADHVEGFSGNPDIFAFIDKMERNLINK